MNLVVRARWCLVEPWAVSDPSVQAEQIFSWTIFCQSHRRDRATNSLLTFAKNAGRFLVSRSWLSKNGIHSRAGSLDTTVNKKRKVFFFRKCLYGCKKCRYFTVWGGAVYVVYKPNMQYNIGSWEHLHYFPTFNTTMELHSSDKGL